MSYQLASLSVHQLDGSSITAAGFGVVIIHPPNSSHLLTLLPSYYLPAAPHHTFSPNALKHYFLPPLVVTKHTSCLSIMLLSKIDLHFPSIPSTVVTSGLDFFHAEGVKRSNIGGVIDI
jgi:hypothetical protein